MNSSLKRQWFIPHQPVWVQQCVTLKSSCVQHLLLELIDALLDPGLASVLSSASSLCSALWVTFQYNSTAQLNQDKSISHGSLPVKAFFKCFLTLTSQ